MTPLADRERAQRLADRLAQVDALMAEAKASFATAALALRRGKPDADARVQAAFASVEKARAGLLPLWDEAQLEAHGTGVPRGEGVGRL